MRFRIIALLCIIVLVGLSCSKSAKAKCKETYFAYRKDFPSVYDIKDTVKLNECIARINEVLACADPKDFEYPLLEKDKLFLLTIKPLIIYKTPRNYTEEQIAVYAEGLEMKVDSINEHRHYSIFTSYDVEQLVKDGVTLDGTISYRPGHSPTIDFDLKFSSHVNGRTVDFVLLEQDTLSYRMDNFILVNFENLSNFSSNPYDRLLGHDPQFTYGTLHPGFEHNDLFSHLDAERALNITWGNPSGSQKMILPRDEVEELVLLINGFERMRTGRP